MNITTTWKSYRDGLPLNKLWWNDSFTDRSSFRRVHILLHLLEGDIKIKFLEVSGPLKKKDEVNICNPFALYVMRKNGHKQLAIDLNRGKNDAPTRKLKI